MIQNRLRTTVVVAAAGGGTFHLFFADYVNALPRC
jgi:hypothetical protein